MFQLRAYKLGKRYTERRTDEPTATIITEPYAAAATTGTQKGRFEDFFIAKRTIMNPI